jgi:hypothetical protein
LKRLAPLVFALIALLALTAPTVASARGGDPDRDGVDNRNEHREGTDPHKRDSDRDGRPDGREDADRDGLSNAAEDASGNDPIDRDTDGDGVRDGREHAGTVASFAGGVLRIRLADGGTIRGDVDDLTELSCPTEGRLEHHQRGHGSMRMHRGGRPVTGKRSPRRGRSAQASSDDPVDDGSDDGATDDEDPGADDEGDDSADDGSDDSTDDGSADDGDLGDDESFDEDWTDDGSNEQGSRSCALRRLHRGARVHESELERGPGGSLFVAVELVR